jgi:Zn-dependent protease with chaperone function
MNFFEAQEKARRNTTLLVLLFIIAVAGLILLTNLVLLSALAYNETGLLIFSLTELRNYLQWDVFIAVAIGVALLIFLGSLYKTMSLSSGGSAVAEMLGGTLVSQNSNKLNERQLLNIVEEMAIAAGTPIPKVYLLNELSINAFAAGKSPSTAVIGVTQGALSQLSRDELQGIIAHEFSHILNGDMQLNLRLIGVLHGILLIGIIGYFMVRSLRYARVSRSEKGGSVLVAVIAAGIGLMVIGYVGTFFGQWIKAVVSRQREYLADASAVQFTRNKDSIAGALKKIGGLSAGSIIESTAAPQYSHAFFANGIASFWQSIFATHPPLEKRIIKIDPHWDGKYITSTQPESQQTPGTPTSTAGATKKSMAGLVVSTAILSTAEQVISQIGTLNEANIEYAQQLLLTLPTSLRRASQNAYTVRAVIYALLIREQNNQSKAWALLEKYADVNMHTLTKKLFTDAKQLDEKLKLPLLELSVNTLRELSESQYLQFKTTVNYIITIDKLVDLDEWVIQRLVMQQLDEHFSLRKPAKAKHALLGAVKADAEIMFSLIAYVEHKNNERAKQAFGKGINEIGAHAFKMIPRDELALDTINKSLDNLMQLKPLLKPRILKACAAIILADDKTTTKGIELFRTIATCLDCPMPPLPA